MTETSIVLSTVFQAADDLIVLADGKFVARYGHVIQVYTNAGVATGSAYPIVPDPFFFGRINIAALENGGFVATWYEFGQTQLKAQVFNSSYQPEGAEIIVSSITNGATNPLVVGLSDSQSLIIWDDAQGATGGILSGQLVNSLGVPQGEAFIIESSTDYIPAIPAVTTLADGNLFLTWTDYDDTAGALASNIWARQLDASGQPTGSSFIVNSATTAELLNAQVTAIDANRIIVTWSENSADTGLPVSFSGRIIDTSNGTSVPEGNEFSFGEFPAGSVGTLDVAKLQDGFFMAVWEQRSDEEVFETFIFNGIPTQVSTGYRTLTAIKGQIFDANGQTVGTEISVATGFDNTNVTNGGYEWLSIPQILNLGNGNVLVSWGKQVDPNANTTDPVYSNPGKIYNFATPTATADAASEVTGTHIALTDLFTWNDGNTLADIVSFSVRDVTANGGYLTNGVVVVTEAIDVLIGDIGLWKFVTGAPGDSDTLEFTVTDAAGLYNPEPAQATITTLSPPTATATANGLALSAVTATPTLLTELFAWDDADDDIVSFSVSIRDLNPNGGYLTNGVVVVTEAIDVPIGDIGLWKFVTGAAGDSDTLEFTVTDAAGLYNPEPAQATITTLSPPTATATANGLDLSAVTATPTLLTELFAWDDADDDIVSFSVSIRELNPNRGYFTQGGVAVTDPLLVNIPIEDINQWAFVSGVLGSADKLDFTVTDAAGLFNSEPATATITTISSAPTAVGTNLSSDAGTSTPLADLFDWNDVDDDIVSFSVRDLSPNGGYLTNGVDVVTEAIDLDISEIGSWSFVTGILGSADTLQFSVTDTAGNTVAAQSTVTTSIPGETWNGTGDHNTHTGTALADLLNGRGGNDTIVGNGGSDVIYGSIGNDRITGVDPGQTQPGLGEIDIMIGGAGEDVFVLGGLNWQGYDDQDTGTVGINDYALITDFTRGEDIIELQGDASQYLQQVDGNKIYIFINKPAGESDELVGVVQNEGGLGALTAQSFRFIKDTDGDGVFDYKDNAILVANANQRDTDGDGYGNIIDADFNNSGRVNATDLTIFASRYGSTDPDADLNGSGRVNATDLTLFAQLFGKVPGLSYINLVPQAPAETSTPIDLDLPFPVVGLVGVPPELPLI